MNRRPITYYVWTVATLAAVAVVVTDWTTLSEASLTDAAGLLGLIAIGMLSEAMAVGLGAGASTSSIVFLPLLASVQLFGPAAGLMLIAVTQSFGEFITRRKPLVRGMFNVAQMVLATAVGGMVFHLMGGVPLEGADSTTISSQLWPFVSFGLVVLAVNHAAVSMAIALDQGLSFRRVWEVLLRNSGASLQDILVSPVALAIAFLYVQFGLFGILVVVLPLLFIRHSYLTASKLRDANQDLLTALVKAIETRDPYTSGHSQRVAHLAREIADQLGLANRVAQQIETAALLHDIGKIEATYTEILAKPGSLTPEERAIIESHVIIGEQLLRDLSSVPEEVVRAVRHHHEREDGLGYPDGLTGASIPVGAKIISICDAIDAMLSDRPYRRALPVSVVVDQLREHAGRQFDARIVGALLSTDLLRRYADMMHGLRDTSAVPHPSSMSAPLRPAARLRRAWITSASH